MVDAAVQYRKNGFNDKDSAQLAQISAMFSNVADEQISAGDAADFIISQLIAFNQVGDNTAENAQHIIDSINEVANSFSVSSGDLSKGLSVVASSSAAMGNSMEQTIGMMTAITEQTRNASKASRGLNTIMARLASVLDESSSNGKAIKQIYADLGLAMEDANGQLLSGYDLLGELAGEWNNLDGNTQKYIATTVAGTTQLNNFLALMNNFGHATEATNTAINSQGSALRENERYMESLNAKVAALKNTFQDFANNVIDNELVGAILDLSNGFLQLANTDLGQMVTQISLLTALGWGSTSLVQASHIIPAVASQFTTFFSIATKGAEATAAAMTAAGTATTAFGAVVSGVLPVILGIAAVAVIGKKIYDAWQDANPTLEEANDRLQTNRDRLAEINELGWKDLTPDIIAEKQALEEENEELERRIALLDESNLKEATRTARASRPQESPNAFYTASGWVDDINQYKTAEEAYLGIAEYMGVAAKSADDAREHLAKLGVTIEAHAGTVEMTANEYNVHLSTALNKYSAQLQKTHELNQEQIQDFNELKAEAGEQVEKLKLMKAAGEDLTPTEQALLTAYERLNDAYEEAIGYSDKLVTTAANNAIAAYNEGVKAGEAEKKVLDLAAAQNIFNQSQLSVDEKIEALGRLAKQAGFTGFALKSMTSAFQRDIDEMGEEAAFEAYWSDFLGFAKKADTTTVTTSGTGTGTSTKSKTDKALDEFNTLQKQIKHQLEMGVIDETTYYNKLEKLVEDYKKKATTHMKEYGLTVNKINENMYSYEEDIYKKRQSLAEELAEKQKQAAEEAEKAWREALEKQKSDMETAVSYLLDKIDEEVETLEQKKTDITNYYNDRIQLVKDTNSELEQQITYEEKLNNLAKAKQQKVYVFKDGRFQYLQDVDKVASAQADLDAYERERVMQEEIDNLEKLRDAEIKDIDEQIEAWKKYKKEWSGVVDQYTKEQNRLIAEQQLGTDFEKKNWKERIKSAQEFADEYNAIMASLDAGFVGDIGDTSNRDLMAEAMQAAKRGDADAAYKLLKMRDAKLDAQGRDSAGGISKSQSRDIIDQILKGTYSGTIPSTSTSSSGGGYYFDYSKSGSGWTEEEMEQGFINGSSSSSSSKGSSSSSGSSSKGSSSSSSSSGRDYMAEAIKAAEKGDIDKANSLLNERDKKLDSQGRDSAGGVSKSESRDIINTILDGYTTSKHAAGTLSAPGGLSLVGEQGPELRVLGQGDGILPADVTRNLWSWGKINPNSISSGFSNIFNIDNISLPDVKDAQSFVSGLKQLAYQRAYKRA